MRIFFTTFLFILGFFGLMAQSSPNKAGTIVEGFEQLEKDRGIQIFYLEEYLPATKTVTFPSKENSIEEAIETLLANTGLSYLNYKNYAFIIAPKDRLELEYDQQYFTKKIALQGESGAVAEKLEEYEVGSTAQYDANKPILLEGFVSDDASE